MSINIDVAAPVVNGEAEPDVNLPVVDAELKKKLKKEEKKKAKKEAKATETPEEKEARRKAKKEKKESKRSKDGPAVTSLEAPVAVIEVAAPTEAVKVEVEAEAPAVAVEAAAPQAAVEAAVPEVAVAAAVPEVAVAAVAPEVEVEAVAPEVAVAAAAPAVAVDAVAPEVEVEAVAPEVAVEAAAPEVAVEAAVPAVAVEAEAPAVVVPPVSAPTTQETENIETEETEEYIDGQLCKVRRSISTKTIITEQIVPLTDVVCTKAPTEKTESVEIQVNVDQGDDTTPPPNLICFCKTPSGKQAYGLLTNNNDGTYTIDINASEPGMHVVDVLNNGKKVPGSPFLINIIQAVDRKKVLLYGKGLQSGLLSEFDGSFHVDTTGAGPGDLKVRVQGPKDTFNVEMSRDENDDRIVNVKYTPTVTGVYSVNVFWSGEHVEGSPVEVILANDDNDLNRFLKGQSGELNADINLDGGLLIQAC